MLVPLVVFTLGLIGYPFVFSVYASLTDKVVGSPGRFVGLANYANLLASPIFVRALRNVFVFTVLTLAAKVVLGMAGALVLNQRFRFRNAFRGMVLLPWVVPSVLSAMGWLWMFDDNFGVVSRVLVETGILKQPVRWLTYPSTAMAAVVIANTWRGTPFFIMSFLAGLQSIEGELYEAAEIDGAGALAKLRAITLPGLKSVTIVAVLFTLVWTVADFNTIHIITGGGPVNSTHVLATLTYQLAIIVGKMGEGIAISVFIVPILAAVGIFLLQRVRH